MMTTTTTTTTTTSLSILNTQNNSSIMSIDLKQDDTFSSNSIFTLSSCQTLDIEQQIVIDRCQNGGTCNVDTGLCLCDFTRFAGALCEIDICSKNLGCNRYGTKECKWTNVQQCICKDGFYGTSCQYYNKCNTQDYKDILKCTKSMG
eukprot:UN10440